MTGFSTRRYPYRRQGVEVELGGETDPFASSGSSTFVRFVLGRDERPAQIASQEVAEHVNDPFASLVLAAGHRPQTLRELLEVLDAATGPDAVPGQRVYRVADGGQIAWSAQTESLDRHLRLVVTRHRRDEAELFVSTAPPFDSEGIFLQVFAWDPLLGAFNFYERRRGVWSWAGSSWDALEPPTRGVGPFDSHVNGGPVMKELKQPWIHWHTQSAQIRDDILAPADPLRNDEFYHLEPPRGLRGAEDLELIVRAGTLRWTRSRLDRGTRDGAIEGGPQLLRHVLTTTTVNLVSAAERSAALGSGSSVRLPSTFFLDADTLLDEIGLPASISRLKVDGAVYRDCVARHAVRLQDSGLSLERDAFFAFVVPEAPLEDRLVRGELLRRGALSRRLAAALLMVDFPNPVFSERRAALLRYLPANLPLDGGSSLERSLIEAVRRSGRQRDPASPEAEFLELWEGQPDGWETAFAAMIEAYWNSLAARLAAADGFDAVFRLAESRRRQFRKRPLLEFGLTLPVATGLELTSPLRMTAGAEVLSAIEEDG